MENHHFNGKIHYKWPFSIAMLVHQWVWPKVGNQNSKESRNQGWFPPKNDQCFMFFVVLQLLNTFDIPMWRHRTRLGMSSHHKPCPLIGSKNYLIDVASNYATPQTTNVSEHKLLPQRILKLKPSFSYLSEGREIGLSEKNRMDKSWGIYPIKWTSHSDLNRGYS